MQILEEAPQEQKQYALDKLAASGNGEEDWQNQEEPAPAGAPESAYEADEDGYAEPEAEAEVEAEEEPAMETEQAEQEVQEEQQPMEEARNICFSES
ncbi:unnamed protein product [Effrenium voratum]|nr:unnamed protein product [Effrenium voratum]